MSSYINMKMILSLKCSGSPCIPSINFWISSWMPNIVNPGIFFHSNSVCMPSMRFNSLKWLSSEYHWILLFLCDRNSFVRIWMLYWCNVLNVVEVGSTDTGTRVSRTVRKACANWMATVCRANTVSGIATDSNTTKAERVTKLHKNVYKAKEALISQTCPWTGWLNDVASLQSEKRVSCQVTVGIVSHLLQTEHRIGEDNGFGSGTLKSSIDSAISLSIPLKSWKLIRLMPVASVWPLISFSVSQKSCPVFQR